MRKTLFLTAVCALLAWPLACDLQKTSNQLRSPHVMVATLLATPPVDVDPLAFSGFDAGSFDGGGLDAGATFDGGVLSIPSHTGAFVFFGMRTSESLDTPPQPLSNATASVLPAGGTAVTLNNDGSGNYSKTSVEDSSFRYSEGANYEFRVVHEGETYVGEVEAVPPLERIGALHPPKGYIEQPVNTSFTFVRPDPPPGKERNLGFVTVVPLGENGERGEPTYSNVPQTPLDFLKLIALPSDWKKTSVTLPGTAFPALDRTYLIVFQSVKSGGPKSDNLFTGSAILAGTADVGVVRTK
ncbi:MAG: hypothetical protein ACOZIN_21455 [Myxococcota bacterium]